MPLKNEIWAENRRWKWQKPSNFDIQISQTVTPFLYKVRVYKAFSPLNLYLRFCFTFCSFKCTQIFISRAGTRYTSPRNGLIKNEYISYLPQYSYVVRKHYSNQGDGGSFIFTRHSRNYLKRGEGTDFAWCKRFYISCCTIIMFKTLWSDHRTPPRHVCL